MTCSFMCLASGVDKLKNGFGGQGDWTCLKCFFEKHADGCHGDCKGCLYGEFFLNINPRTNILELVCKDARYADDLVSAFRSAMVG